ncbi:MAG: LuxR family transcriptional regulator [Chloroflexi bacterium]|nr:LuxR family transcriptional regulator [Chloroflexota bacterium]
MSQPMGDQLAAARDAFLTHEWANALDLFKQADGGEGLTPEDLESMAEAAWWAARPDEAIEVLQRAYAGYLGVGKHARAGYVALSLAREYGVKFATSVATGWFNRAKRLLEAEPESAELGYLYGRQSVQALNAERFDEAIEAARRAVDVGVRVGDRNLQAIGAVYQGAALVEKGDVAEGLSLIDDAALAAVSGELGLFATGTVYCNTIATCCGIADFARARDWADAADQWSTTHPEQPLIPGDCRIHQAEVLALRGAWAEAEESARRGAEELRAFNRLYHVGEALYQIGVIRLHMGDLAGAHDLFAQASELGRDPQPGLSMLLLSERKVAAAMASISRALDEETASRLSRARLLPAFVEISLANRNLHAAQIAADELESIAITYDAPSLHAATDSARGALLLAAGEVTGAVPALRRAVSRWQEVQAPYEAARARGALAQAIGLKGDVDSARLELQAARSTFERLGAIPDARRIDMLWEEIDGRTDATAPTVRTFMFTDIVKSTNLVEAIGDEAWVDLLRWHDQTLRALFAEYHGDELDHAGDGFFVVFDGPEGALSCSVAIQQGLAEHRRSHGFAPQVRIGVHAASATRSGGAYRGKGVHEAARIAAVAQGGEIVASRTSLEGLTQQFPASLPQAVTLKGISEPVEVVTIDWRSMGE